MGSTPHPSPIEQFSDRGAYFAKESVQVRDNLASATIRPSQLPKVRSVLENTGKTVSAVFSFLFSFPDADRLVSDSKSLTGERKDNA